MPRRFFWTSFLLAVLTACAPAPTASVTPAAAAVTPSRTPFLPLPDYSSTPEAASATATISELPMETNTPEAVFTATLFPFPDLNPSSAEPSSDVPQPDARNGAIQFYSPGPLSKIVSPVVFNGYAIPGHGNMGRVDLYGEDGRLLASDLLQLNTSYTWAYFSWSLPFEVQAAGELGRLTVSTQDQYGRLTALESVHLLLLSQGTSQVNPSGDLRERCVIEQPSAGQQVSGGALSLTGMIRPFNSQPLLVELIKRDGGVVAAQWVMFSPASDGSYVPFSAEISYSVGAGTWALLSVSQPDERIPGTMYLYSREIFLNP